MLRTLADPSQQFYSRPAVSIARPSYSVCPRVSQPITGSACCFGPWPRLARCSSPFLTRAVRVLASPRHSEGISRRTTKEQQSESEDTRMIHMRPLPPPHRPGTRLNLIPKAQGDVAFSDSNAPRITLDMHTDTDRTGQDRT